MLSRKSDLHARARMESSRTINDNRQTTYLVAFITMYGDG